MKKLLLFVLFSLLFSQFIFAQKESNLSLTQEEETFYWKFLKERLFNGYSYSVPRFVEEVNIQVFGATSTDSIAIKNTIALLKELVNNKINYVKEDGNLVLKLQVNPEFEYDSNYSPNIDSFSATASREYPLGKINKAKIILPVNDNLSMAERKKLFQYTLVRSLLHYKYHGHTAPDAPYNVESAILNLPRKNPLETEFTKADKFVISKLYALDFQRQFRKFMIREYSLLAYLKFTNSNLMRIIGYSVYSILLLIFLVLSFKTIFTKTFKINYFNYILPTLAIVLAILISNGAYEVLAVSNGGSRELGTSIIRIVMVLLVSTALVTLLYFLENFFIKSGYSITKRVVLKFIFVMFTTVVVALIVYNSEENGKNGMSHLFILLFGLVIALARSSFVYFRQSAENILREKDLQLSQLKELKAKAEVASLHARINPHFLYNSLNSIAGLAHSDPQKTEQMALSLSDLFRHSINRENQLTATVLEEIEAVKAYLEIEQIRFGENMSFALDVDEQAEEQIIPRNIIQPLVENAIKHGISKIKEKGIIRVMVKKGAEGILIVVTDNGPNFPDGNISGYGLQSVYDILNLSYKEEASLNWENEPCKRIWIKITNEGLKKTVENV